MPDAIFSFGASGADQLATALNIPHEKIEVHRFPDNEACVRIARTGAVSGHVAVLRALDNPDSKLIELLLAASVLRTAGARTLTLIAPYLCYMRQDSEFRPGEAVSQRVIGELLARAFDRFVAIEPHLHRTPTLDRVFAGKPALALSAAPAIAAHLRKRWRDGTFLIGPDEESTPLVRQVAVLLGAPWAVCRKVREGDRAVRFTLPNGEDLARPIVIVDDVISSGATIATLARTLRAAAATSIDVYVTHALFDAAAGAAMREAGVREILSCDTVPHPSNAMSIAPVIAAALEPWEQISRVD